MNIETNGRGNENDRERAIGRTGGIRRSGQAVAVGVAVAASIGVLIISALAVPQPVLRISPLGSNQFNIVITNGVSGTNYTLFWTPAMADENYPWQVWGIGGTNFVVDGEDWPNLFFKVLVGSDSDGDGVTEEQDANSNDPTVRVLSVTINSPTNNAVLQ